MSESASKPKYISAKAASEELGVHLSTLRLWAIKGKIDVICTPGRRYRYNIDAFMARAQAATKAKLERDAKRLEVKEARQRQTQHAKRIAKIAERRKLAEDQGKLI